MITRKKTLLLTVFVVATMSSAFTVCKANHSQDQTRDEAAALNDQAVDLFESHRYDEAIGLLERAMKLKPERATAHYNLGCIYQTQGRFAAAIEAFKQAVRLKPDFTDAHHLMGVAYSKIEHYTDAIECFKLALQLKPDRLESLIELGFAYSQF